ncbi:MULTISPECIES: hypothetical protein [unclassified Novosphingobium]|uniref:hypothetical protein n=1 Tax=unclassified Novosphingobium TaxID=2644732 RepID=UPI0025F83A94|nr:MULTISPECIES: hypothetical protein [unclassified Novosphingobium]
MSEEAALILPPSVECILSEVRDGIRKNGMLHPTDAQILAAVGKWGNRSMTYAVRNVLQMAGFKVETAWLLRRLKRLEREGKVVRVSSGYAIQLCWSVPTPTAVVS